MVCKKVKSCYQNKDGKAEDGDGGGSTVPQESAIWNTIYTAELLLSADIGRQERIGMTDRTFPFWVVRCSSGAGLPQVRWHSVRCARDRVSITRLLAAAEARNIGKDYKRARLVVGEKYCATAGCEGERDWQRICEHVCAPSVMPPAAVRFLNPMSACCVWGRMFLFDDPDVFWGLIGVSLYTVGPFWTTRTWHCFSANLVQPNYGHFNLLMGGFRPDGFSPNTGGLLVRLHATFACPCHLRGLHFAADVAFLAAQHNYLCCFDASPKYHANKERPQPRWLN